MSSLQAPEEERAEGAQESVSVNQKTTAAEARYSAMIRTLPCIICKRLGFALTARVEVHHIAKGSSRQNNWLVAPLCAEHHRGSSGLHGMGERAFVLLYHVPHGTEYGLLALVNEDLMEALGLKNRGALARSNSSIGSE